MATDDGVVTETDDTPTDSEVVETGATAARELVLSRFETDEVRDLDVTVAFEDGVLEVDVYLDVPEPGTRDPDRVADDAALAARRAVDRLFEGDTDADTDGA
ncbi:DUF3194 domain-containing protein [Halobacteriales archaeon SW_7_71_33]|nr:MAG: DUF3194 domain-containing protein [Halobacteriales archaeon SW_7_71_33]